jgi:hypothetical protein
MDALGCGGPAGKIVNSLREIRHIRVDVMSEAFDIFTQTKQLLFRGCACSPVVQDHPHNRWHD